MRPGYLTLNVEIRETRICGSTHFRGAGGLAFSPLLSCTLDCEECKVTLIIPMPLWCITTMICPLNETWSTSLLLSKTGFGQIESGASRSSFYVGTHLRMLLHCYCDHGCGLDVDVIMLSLSWLISESSGVEIPLLQLNCCGSLSSWWLYTSEASCHILFHLFLIPMRAPRPTEIRVSWLLNRVAVADTQKLHTK